MHNDLHSSEEMKSFISLILSATQKLEKHQDLKL